MIGVDTKEANHSV